MNEINAEENENQNFNNFNNGTCIPDYSKNEEYQNFKKSYSDPDSDSPSVFTAQICNQVDKASFNILNCLLNEAQHEYYNKTYHLEKFVKNRQNQKKHLTDENEKTSKMLKMKGEEFAEAKRKLSNQKSVTETAKTVAFGLEAEILKMTNEIEVLKLENTNYNQIEIDYKAFEKRNSSLNEDLKELKAKSKNLEKERTEFAKFHLRMAHKIGKKLMAAKKLRARVQQKYDKNELKKQDGLKAKEVFTELLNYLMKLKSLIV